MHIKMGRTAKRTAVIGAVAALGCAVAPAALAQSVVYVPCSTTALATDISTAASGDTLFLKAGCTYGLTTALPDITTNLNLVGVNGATLNGESSGFSILTVDSGARLTVTNVNFTNGGGTGIGATSFGGAIDSDGIVAVHGGTFTDNVSAEYGGAIYNDDVMTVTGASFIGNSAPGEYGGAIYNDDVMKVTGSTFLRNSADDGGAIYNDDPSFALTTSTLTRNDAEYGGGLYLDYPGQVSGDTFNGNSAEFYGGGIYIDDATTLNSVTLHGNKAEYGGGIYIDDVGTVAVVQSTITGNDVTEQGGGVYDYFSNLIMTNTPVTGNAATFGGGGIYNDGGTVTLNHSWVTLNAPDNCEPTGTIATCTG
jgi:predicted outer membrane repeat protein